MQSKAEKEQDSSFSVSTTALPTPPNSCGKPFWYLTRMKLKNSVYPINAARAITSVIYD